MSNMGTLGNFEEFLRPFLGRIVFTECVHGSTRVRREAADDYGSLHPLHHRFSGDRRSWCLTGFNRALKEKPKVIGLLVRVEINDVSMRQRKAKVIAFPGHSAPPQPAGAARVRKYRSLSLLFFVGIATLLASPAPNRNSSALASAIPNWNSEIQKTMFVELSEMRVRGS